MSGLMKGLCPGGEEPFDVDSSNGTALQRHRSPLANDEDDNDQMVGGMCNHGDREHCGHCNPTPVIYTPAPSTNTWSYLENGGSDEFNPAGGYDHIAGMIGRARSVGAVYSGIHDYGDRVPEELFRTRDFYDADDDDEIEQVQDDEKNALEPRLRFVDRLALGRPVKGLVYPFNCALNDHSFAFDVTFCHDYNENVATLCDNQTLRDHNPIRIALNGPKSIYKHLQKFFRFLPNTYQVTPQLIRLMGASIKGISCPLVIQLLTPVIVRKQKSGTYAAWLSRHSVSGIAGVPPGYVIHKKELSAADAADLFIASADVAARGHVLYKAVDFDALGTQARGYLSGNIHRIPISAPDEEQAVVDDTLGFITAKRAHCVTRAIKKANKGRLITFESLANRRNPQARGLVSTLDAGTTKQALDIPEPCMSDLLQRAQSQVNAPEKLACLDDVILEGYPLKEGGWQAVDAKDEGGHLRENLSISVTLRLVVSPVTSHHCTVAEKASQAPLLLGQQAHTPYEQNIMLQNAISGQY